MIECWTFSHTATPQAIIVIKYHGWCLARTYLSFNVSVNKSLESIPNEQNEQLRSFSDKLAKFSGGIEDSFENELCNYVNSVVKECESNDIEYQKKVGITVLLLI